MPKFFLVRLCRTFSSVSPRSQRTSSMARASFRLRMVSRGTMRSKEMRFSARMFPFRSLMKPLGAKRTSFLRMFRRDVAR
ncbi:MAG: hypothetical protein BWY86_00940 [Candidatus Aminicenantes bacterium ADurb.Bin508]|nr:MAG: hypothetical protein BWY86_00940 [Candidatus Aminicenantes bacterium ADurb.Bin508]